MNLDFGLPFIPRDTRLSSRAPPRSQISQPIPSDSFQIGSDLPVSRADPARNLRLALSTQTQPLPEQSAIDHAPTTGAVALDGPESTRVQTAGVFDGTGQLGLESRQSTVRFLRDGRD